MEALELYQFRHISVVWDLLIQNPVSQAVKRLLVLLKSSGMKYWNYTIVIEFFCLLVLNIDPIRGVAVMTNEKPVLCIIGLF